MSTIKLVVGGLLLASGAVMALGAFKVLLDKKSDAEQLVMFAVVALWLAVAYGGYRLIDSQMLNRRPSARRDPVALEQDILALARTNGGRLTVAQVAAHARITVSESRRLLDNFVSQKVARLQVTEDGSQVYRFPSAVASPGAEPVADS